MTDQKPIADVRSTMADDLDRDLADRLRNGEEKIVVVDGVPEKVKVRPCAATLRVIKDRIRELGIQSPTGAGRGADDLLAAARQNLRFPGGGAIPPMSDDADAASA